MTNAAITAIRQIATTTPTIKAAEKLTAIELELLPGKQSRNKNMTVAFTDAGIYRWNESERLWVRQ